MNEDTRRWVVEKLVGDRWVPTNTWADEEGFINDVVAVANKTYPDSSFRAACWKRLILNCKERDCNGEQSFYGDLFPV